MKIQQLLKNTQYKEVVKDAQAFHKYSSGESIKASIDSAVDSVQNAAGTVLMGTAGVFEAGRNGSPAELAGAIALGIPATILKATAQFAQALTAVAEAALHVGLSVVPAMHEPVAIQFDGSLFKAAKLKKHSGEGWVEVTRENGLKSFVEYSKLPKELQAKVES